MESNKDLLFLHLSDIHFKQFKAGTYLINSDLKNEIQRDIESFVSNGTEVDGIFITGDIAFSGMDEEYILAKEWLEKICKLTQCDFTKVFVIPGNHDINRTEQKRPFKSLAGELHKINTEDYNSVDQLFREDLLDEESANVLFKHLKNYNDFALIYNCVTDQENVFWEYDYSLNDNSILRVRGLNSVIISSDEDNNYNKKLLLGTDQFVARNDYGVTYLFLCHHPPSWLKDEATLEDYLAGRVHIQLFGHKHRQRLDQINNSVRISSGAVFPSQNEPNWEPRYNFINISVASKEANRMLEIKVYPRVFSQSSTKFIPEYFEGKEYKFFKLQLDDWKYIENNKSDEEIVMMPESSKLSQQSVSLRNLAYELFSLPYTKFVEIALKLDVLNNEDKDIELYKLKKEILKRIIDKNYQEELKKVLSEIK